jgi:hypothetical protein
MKRYLIIGALLVSAITSHAQTGGAVDSFFHANYNLPNLAQYANRQVGQVSYRSALATLPQHSCYSGSGQSFARSLHAQSFTRYPGGIEIRARHSRPR